MHTLPEIAPGRLGVLVSPRTLQETMMRLTAVLALRGPVRILDSGNQFDAYGVARHLRRQTPQLEGALNRLTIARAFTCYQMVTLLTQTPATAVPILVLDLLSTFTDESVDLAESQRLLRLAIQQLHRLQQHAPILVSLRPTPQPERAGLVTMLVKAADMVLAPEVEPVILTPTLF